jgi:acyl-CoA reductase-like NAD-dependent aldehyde dehydrogenase
LVITTANYGLYINGEWISRAGQIPVVDKYTGETWAEVAVADATAVAAAAQAARSAVDGAALPPNRRAEILRSVAAILSRRREEIGLAISREVGKPYREACWEVDWSAGVFAASAEECIRLCGTMVPIEGEYGCEDRLAFTLRVPVGVVAAITPFNFPLNQAAHKVGPALGAGNAVVLKPAPNTPVSCAMLAEVMAEAGLPAGWFNVVQGGADVGQQLVENPAVDFISFTGSAAAGRLVSKAAGLRRVSLELGSNAATIVHADADLGRAAALVAWGAFNNAGQVCISVQRVLVHESVYSNFCQLLADEAAKAVTGNPMDEATTVGPMISLEAAQRAEAWVRAAVAGGARQLAGGKREGALFWPAVLADVSAAMRVSCEEVFAPVVAVAPYASLDEAIDRVNDSAYGLQAGIFTANIGAALAAARRLKVGGVIINDTSYFRRDSMPYGGVKASGMGREGPRHAMEEMTDLRTVVVRA